jgi:hypothetical protein
MTKLKQAATVKVRLFGTQLNMVAALVVAYMAANGAAIEQAVNSIVPEPYQPLASVLVGLASFLLVNAASNSDLRRTADATARRLRLDQIAGGSRHE